MLVGIVEDNGMSAHDLERPGFAQLFKDLATGRIRFVIAADLARFARTVPNLLYIFRRFARHGASAIVADQPLNDRTSDGGRALRAQPRLPSSIE